MSVLDDMANILVDMSEAMGVQPVDVVDLIAEGEEPSLILAAMLDAATPVDELVGFIVDGAEEFILAEIQAEGIIDLENVEGVQDRTEGNAVTFLSTVLAMSAAAEVLTGGQVDIVNHDIVQAVVGIGVDDVTGREIDARQQHGLDPALKQLAHRDHRSKQANIPDHIEANLRSKWAAGEIPTRSGDLPEALVDLFAPQDFGWLADPDTYGTIPDQTPLYELVSLAHLEPEELFEELPQKGVIPSRAATEQILHTAGLPEDIKEGYLELWRNLPKSQDLIQEGIRLEEPIRVIDEAVFENRMSVQEAVAFVRSDVEAYITVSDAEGTPQDLERSPEAVIEVVIGELRARWQLIASVPNSAPTRGQLERWFRNGVISALQFNELNRAFGIMPEYFGDMLIDNAIRQGGEDIARQHILGRITAGEAQFRLGFIGFNQDEAARILAGADPDDVVEDRFTAQADEGTLPVSLAVEIGDSRSAQLRAVGVDSLSILADLDVEALTAITGMSDIEAQQAIDSAQLILSQSET